MISPPRRPQFGEMPWAVTQHRLDELEATLANRFDKGDCEMKLNLEKLAEAVHKLEAKVAELEADHVADQEAIDKLVAELEGTGASEGGIK